VPLNLDESVQMFAQYAEHAVDESIAKVYRETTPRHPIFGRDRVANAVPIVEGPRSDDDSLRRIWRVTDRLTLGRLYASSSALLGASPLLLAPSRYKLVYSPTLIDFWNGMGRSGGMALGMGIIGFSLPPHDEYVLQALYSLTRNYTEYSSDTRILDKKKLPLRLVDLQPTEQGRRSYLERYRFVNWQRAECFFEGFGDAAIDFLFQESRRIRRREPAPATRPPLDG
jgi:hypothetical protein